MIGFKNILYKDRLLGDDNRVYKLINNELRVTEYQFPIIEYYTGDQVGYKEGICYIPTDDGYKEIELEISPEFSMIDDNLCIIADKYSMYKLVDNAFEKIHQFEDEILSMDIYGTEYAVLFKDVIIWYTDYGVNTLHQENVSQLNITSRNAYIVNDDERLFEWKRDGSLSKIIEECISVSSWDNYVCYSTQNETYTLNIDTNECIVTPYYSECYGCDDHGITLFELKGELYINDRLITEDDGPMEHGNFREYYHDENRIILLFDRAVKIWENGNIIDVLNPYDIIERLENMLSFAPGGEGYERTKDHFEEMVK